MWHKLYDITRYVADAVRDSDYVVRPLYESFVLSLSRPF